jgi:hypothetical protein
MTQPERVANGYTGSSSRMIPKIDLAADDVVSGDA